MGQVLSNLISIIFGRKQKVYHAPDDHCEEVKPIHPTSGYGKTRVSEEDEGSVVIVITDADQVREDAAEPFSLVSGDPETRLSEDERVITIIVGNGVEAVEKIKPVADDEVRVDAEPFPLLFVDPKTRVSEDERAREDVDPYLLVSVDSKPRISEDEKVREDAAEPFPLVSWSPETRVSEDERVITIIVDSGVEAAEKIKPTLDVSTGDKITVPKDGSRAKRRKRRAKRKPRVSEDEKVREDVADPFPPASVYRHQTKVSEDESGASIVDNGVEVVEKIEHIIHISTGDKITVSKDDLQEERRIKHYSCSHTILLVGEGDFSFSACLAKAFGSANNMVATSLDSEGFLKKNYRKAMSNINDLKSRGCMVLHGVDATTMSSHEFLKDMRFDRIVFNFPYAGWFKKKSRENQIRERTEFHNGFMYAFQRFVCRHQKLVTLFFKNSKKLLSREGEIHISHKSVGFHYEWNIVSLASLSGLNFIKAVKFNLNDYLGYSTKYGFGRDFYFNCNPSKTYMFGPMDDEAD